MRVSDRAARLDIAYQDDTSQPDTAAQLVDRFNDQGVTLVLGPYGSASTEAASAVAERNGQVMVSGAGDDDKIFAKVYRRTFAVLSPASRYVAAIVQAVAEQAAPKPRAGRVRPSPHATDVSAALTRIRPLGLTCSSARCTWRRVSRSSSKTPSWA